VYEYEMLLSNGYIVVAISDWVYINKLMVYEKRSIFFVYLSKTISIVKWVDILFGGVEV
jgi:putative cell wall-binding protein